MLKFSGKAIKNKTKKEFLCSETKDNNKKLLPTCPQQILNGHALDQQTTDNFQSLPYFLQKKFFLKKRKQNSTKNFWLKSIRTKPLSCVPNHYQS